jgi:hypothetical protein
MNWLARWLGLDKIVKQLEDAFFQNSGRLEELFGEKTQQLDMLLAENSDQLEDAFYQGVIKLDLDAVYIVHMKENTSDEMCDRLRQVLSDRGINCVIVATDKLHVINL